MFLSCHVAPVSAHLHASAALPASLGTWLNSVVPQSSSPIHTHRRSMQPSFGQLFIPCPVSCGQGPGSPSPQQGLKNKLPEEGLLNRRALSAMGPQVCSFNLKYGLCPGPSWEFGKNRARTKFGNRKMYAPLHPLAPTSWFFQCTECQTASSSNILILQLNLQKKNCHLPFGGSGFQCLNCVW